MLSQRDISRRKALSLILKAGIAATIPFSTILGSRFTWHGQSLRYFQKMSFVMGQLLSMEVLAPGPAEAARAFRRCTAVFFDYDRRLSMFRENSEANRLSRSAGTGFIQISPVTARAMETAIQYGHQTEGMFDISIGPLLQRLGFRDEKNQAVLPLTPVEKDALKQQVNYQWIEVRGQEVRLAHPGMALDFGGIACGLALDAAIDTLKRMNIGAAFLNISGDIAGYGASEIGGEGWKVYLKDPASGEPQKMRPLILKNEALSTSGNTENYRRLQNGARTGHILNPFTLQSSPLTGSLTVISPGALQADIWSTAGWAGTPLPSHLKSIRLG